MPRAAPLYLTAHAIRRFAERVEGIAVHGAVDSEAIRKLWADGALDIAAISAELERVTQLAADLGACAVLYRGFRIVIVDGAIVSVVPMGKSRRRGPRIGREAN